MATILVTVGPIPAQLDSVKFLTNRFKGGLALRTAHYLAEQGHAVDVVAWDHTPLETTLPVRRVRDVVHYVDEVLKEPRDMFVLAAAVANLMPSTPYEGKFPSHLYEVGERFSIEFEIAPRVIDQVKARYPRSALVGYKLFDGDDNALLRAANKTLRESRATVVFANHPRQAKHTKWVLTQDGAVWPASFEEHLRVLDRLARSVYYTTQCVGEPDDEPMDDVEKEVYAWFPRHVAKDGAHTYGTFAVRRGEQGFLTTSRGKKATPGGYALAHVLDVDHGEKRVVCHGQKATLNAPLLAKILEINPRFCIVLHGHDVEENTPEAIRVTEDYTFPGADNDLVHAVVTKPAKVVWMPRHGWWAGFENIDQMRAFIAQRNAAGAAHA